MTPQEQLKAIKGLGLIEHVGQASFDWLVARVEQLEAVILDLYGPDCVAMKTGPKPE